MSSGSSINLVQVFCIGTADTKLEVLRFLCDSVQSNLKNFTTDSSSVKVHVSIIDVSTGDKEIQSCGDFKFVSRKDVLSSYSEPLRDGSCSLPTDRGEAIAVMNNALTKFLVAAHRHEDLCGVIGLGGSGGTSLLSSASVALYGLGNIRDERLNRMFQTPHAVQWMRPEAQEGCEVSDWFNMLVLHQNKFFSSVSCLVQLGDSPNELQTPVKQDSQKMLGDIQPMKRSRSSASEAAPKASFVSRESS